MKLSNLLAFSVASVFVFASAFVIFSSEKAVAQTFDNVTVDVTIQAISEITVTPTYINFSVVPGTASTPPNLIDIKNTGSLNVSLIHVYTDTLVDESTRPYGSPNTTNYAAGGVIVISNETNTSRYFAGRIEWNQTEDISNMVDTAVTSPVAWGFIRNASNEYNFLLGNGTPSIGSNNAYCNGTGSQLAIDDDIDNGTVITRTPLTTLLQRDGGDLEWSYFSVNRVTSPIPHSCVAVYWNCQKVYIYKYDRRSGFNTCVNSRFLQSDNLIPGDTHTMNLSVYVPFGIPSLPGQMNTSTVTISGS